MIGREQTRGMIRPRNTAEMGGLASIVQHSFAGGITITGDTDHSDTLNEAKICIHHPLQRWINIMTILTR